MKVGLLWYDPDPKKPAQEKIDEAATRYVERLGVAPNACHVNPTQLTTHPSLRVVASPWVRPFNFWVGVDESVGAVQRAEQRQVKAPRSAASPARRAA
jgi:hypothetical protein